MRWAYTTLGLALAFGACGDQPAQPSPASETATPATTTTAIPDPSTTSSASTSQASQIYPHVVDVTVTKVGDKYRFEVTISSPYDTPQRYADAWRVVGPDGEVYGIRELLHDHAAEQPFTRSLDGVEIPDGIDVVTVEGRDLVNGWGGEVMEVELPD